eukprot:178155-Chlamydomonas_euryale.AAC.1
MPSARQNVHLAHASPLPTKTHAGEVHGRPVGALITPLPFPPSVSPVLNLPSPPFTPPSFPLPSLPPKRQLCTPRTQAKSVGDQLVLGLIPDSEIMRCKGPPVMNEEERYTLVEQVKWVDEVIRGEPSASARCMVGCGAAARA